jgi:hypothetical protein
LVKVVVDDVVRALFIVDAITDFVEQRGVRSFTVSSRTRDGLEGWRTARATSPLFGQGTNYRAMMVRICDVIMGTSEPEHNFLPINLTVPHSNVQFSGTTPWDMLEEIASAAGMEPFVDVKNVVRTFRYDTMRVHDIAVSNASIVEFGTARQLSSSAVGSFRLTWLDPLLKKKFQTSQVLGTATLTAGFFKGFVTQEVWYSQDRRQRAENTFMRVIDSVNDGGLGLEVATESYRPIDPFYGQIVLTTAWWVPTLYTVALIALLVYDQIPDAVVGTVTVPVGRVVHGIALVVILGITMSIGTGNYEVWGEPYDYVHAKNTTVVQACNLNFHYMSREELDTSLVVSEAHAQEMAVQLLTYRLAANYELQVRLLDDPRIEKGDILLFADGSRMMVSGFSNDFSRGSEAVMSVTGFLL